MTVERKFIDFNNILRPFDVIESMNGTKSVYIGKSQLTSEELKVLNDTNNLHGISKIYRRPIGNFYCITDARVMFSSDFAEYNVIYSSADGNNIYTFSLEEVIETLIKANDIQPKNIIKINTTNTWNEQPLLMHSATVPDNRERSPR